MEKHRVMNSRKDKELYKKSTNYQFEQAELALGPWTSYSLVNDPKHMCFVLSRYKFVCKMLEGKKTVMEIGAGDGFGLPIIAKSTEHVYAVDWDKRLVEGNARRLAHLNNVSHLHVDLNETSPGIVVDAAFMIDVIEHVDPAKQDIFMENILRCLKPNGVLIIGTPNTTASQYATHGSQLSHINLKDMKTLRELTEHYFENVFMFGMNDEMIHTGYAPMCQYIWSIGAGLRRVSEDKP